MKKKSAELWEKEKRELIEKMIEKISAFTFLPENPSQEAQAQK